MFSRLTGNQRVKDSLRRMLSNSRVPGALLLVGEEGVGKKLFALELAKSLNCRTRVLNVEACDACSSCRRIDQSTFPSHSTVEENKERMIWSLHTDMGLVRPFNRIIRVPPMREIDREANFRPFEGNARVFIIDDADRMNEASQNALLKTLEEPPSTSHLVLITSRPASLLPTIRSRSQVLRFVPLTSSEIEEQLHKLDNTLALQAVHIRASAARGSIGRAVSLNLEDYLEQRRAMFEVLEVLAITRDRARLLRASEELSDAKHKDEYEPRLSLLSSLIHDAWKLSLGATVNELANDDLVEDLSKIGDRLDNHRAARWLTQIETHRRKLDVNINRKIATDALLLSMAEN